MNTINLHLILVLILLVCTDLFSQVNSEKLDSNLNNLVHPPGYKTCKIGVTGKTDISGSGKKTMILIAGLGFGSGVYREFIEHFNTEYTVYTVTPAGFEGTDAPEMPDSTVKYSALSWTRGIVTAIVNLIENNKLVKPVIAAHFVTGTQVSLILSEEYPDLAGKIIIIGGAPYRYYPGAKDRQWNDWENEKKLTPEQRSIITETWWAPQWFKMVTKKTWDENMWTANDYCIDTVKGNKLFNISAEVPLQVMVRYLIEWGDYDPGTLYSRIKLPLLIIQPDFNGIFTITDIPGKECEVPSAKQYLKYFHQAAWNDALTSGNNFIKVHTIQNSRLFTWLDNPDSTFKVIDNFLNE